MKQIFISLFILFTLASNAQPTSGLMAYWRLDGNFTDSTSNAINGTNNGATATTNNLAAANKAMNFANTTGTVVQYATAPINAAINFTGDFSIDFSFYVSSNSHNWGYFDNCLNYNGYGVWGWNNNGNRLNFNYKNTSVSTKFSDNLQLNTWYHACCLSASGTIKIYLNGVLDSSVNLGASVPTYPYGARFGTMFYGSMTPPEYNGLQGKIDNIRIYNRALSQAEITQLYNLWLTPVPVKLTDFSATKLHNSVALNWQTQTEQNSSLFNIERSTDGVSFFTAGTVLANGNSNATIKYNFIDNNIPNAPTIYYRLKMIDKDGKYEFSRAIRINGAPKASALIYPNPTKESFVLTAGSNDLINTTAIILDETGKLVKKFMIKATTQTIAIQNLSAGTYTIKLANNEVIKLQISH